MNNLFIQSSEKKSPDYRLAVVYKVGENGLQLKFDGEETPTKKYYKALSSCNADVGDRVTCQAISGTYIVTGVLGKPPAQPSNIKIATVTDVSASGLKIRFQSDNQDSGYHEILISCDAAVGDRVLCLSVDNTYIIVGVIGKTRNINADKIYDDWKKTNSRSSATIDFTTLSLSGKLYLNAYDNDVKGNIPLANR